MTNFVDPRTGPAPDEHTPSERTTSDPDELEELREMCRAGQLYAVEDWIREGRPMQLDEERPSRRTRWSSPLEIAMEDGNHALVHLLLCNGYDPNAERHCPLNQALEDRRDQVPKVVEFRLPPDRRIRVQAAG